MPKGPTAGCRPGPGSLTCPLLVSRTLSPLPLAQDFDHHCRWVNNCIGHRNLGLFILLLLCLCLYLGSMLVTCMVFLLRTTHLPFSIDKVIAYPPGCRVHLASCGQG